MNNFALWQVNPAGSDQPGRPGPTRKLDRPPDPARTT